MKSTTRRLTRTLQNMRPRHRETALAACSQPALAQPAAPSILRIDVANNVLYDGDSSDVSKFVTDPNNIRRFQVRVDHTLVMGMLHSAADRGD